MIMTLSLRYTNTGLREISEIYNIYRGQVCILEYISRILLMEGSNVTWKRRGNFQSLNLLSI